MKLVSKSKVSEYVVNIVKLLAKSKLKSLPYNHTDHPPHPQLSIKSKQVYTSPTSTYDTFLESLGQDLSNPAYIGLISGAILTPQP